VDICLALLVRVMRQGRHYPLNCSGRRVLDINLQLRNLFEGAIVQRPALGVEVELSPGCHRLTRQSFHVRGRHGSALPLEIDAAFVFDGFDRP